MLAVGLVESICLLSHSCIHLLVFNISTCAATTNERQLDAMFVATKSPSDSPSFVPSFDPTASPTFNPSGAPSNSPTLAPVPDPTHLPSLSPSSQPIVITSSPTATPTEPVTMAPTMCKESYLTSENLNIALVVDLSHSTYKNEFHSEGNIGDVNGDGKADSILDATILAITHLLMSIADSATLNNMNCEIAIISFHTDATYHGTFSPTNAGGTDVNGILMNLLTSEEFYAVENTTEIMKTNNGFTNFDAALDKTVEYFDTTATKDRNNLMVFLSDGVPNVRGDGDQELYCNETVTFWIDADESITYKCSDLKLKEGEEHLFCLANDGACVKEEQYQECVRGTQSCNNANATTQFESELALLDAMEVERLAIGIGPDTDVSTGSPLWEIDANPAKENGTLPLQALNADELTVYLSSLCILTTEAPTSSPTFNPTVSPTFNPTGAPTSSPTGTPTVSPTFNPTGAPTSSPTGTPTVSPTVNPTGAPTSSPTGTPTVTPTLNPTKSPTVSPVSQTVEQTDEPTDQIVKSPPLGPEECPQGLSLIKHVGDNELPDGAVTILSHGSETVTVRVNNTYSENEVKYFYYQFNTDHFNNKCYEKDNFETDESMEITIQCTVMSKIAFLEIWVADDTPVTGNTAVVPDCCYPTNTSDVTFSKYVVQIKCCPEDVQ